MKADDPLMRTVDYLIFRFRDMPDEDRRDLAEYILAYDEVESNGDEADYRAGLAEILAGEPVSSMPMEMRPPG